MASKPATDNAAFDDHRYPRPPWFRALRWILRSWWLLLSTLPVIIFVNAIAIAVHQGLIALIDPATLRRVLLLDALTAFLQQHPLVTLLAIGLAGLLAYLGAWANADLRREIAILQMRHAVLVEAQVTAERSTVAPAPPSGSSQPVDSSQQGAASTPASGAPTPTPAPPDAAEDSNDIAALATAVQQLSRSGRQQLFVVIAIAAVGWALSIIQILKMH